MWFYLWLRLKPSLANAIVFTIKNVAPVVLFGYAVYLAAALLIPGAGPSAWKIIAFLCAMLAVLDRLKGRAS